MLHTAVLTTLRAGLVLIGSRHSSLVVTGAVRIGSTGQQAYRAVPLQARCGLSQHLLAVTKRAGLPATE